MKVAVMAGLFAEWYMYVDSAHNLVVSGHLLKPVTIFLHGIHYFLQKHPSLYNFFRQLFFLN